MGDLDLLRNKPISRGNYIKNKYIRLELKRKRDLKFRYVQISTSLKLHMEHFVT